MNKIFFILALAGLLLGFKVLSGQTADCQKQCQENLKVCKAGCAEAGSDSAGCNERCVKENAGCLSKCGPARPDAASIDSDDDGLDDDAEYNDDSLDDESQYED